MAGLTAKSPLRDQQQHMTNISNNQQQLVGNGGSGKGVIQGERTRVDSSSNGGSSISSNGGTRVIGVIKK